MVIRPVFLLRREIGVVAARAQSSRNIHETACLPARRYLHFRITNIGGRLSEPVHTADTRRYLRNTPQHLIAASTVYTCPRSHCVVDTNGKDHIGTESKCYKQHEYIDVSETDARSV